MYMVPIKVALATAARINGPRFWCFLTSMNTSNRVATANSDIAAACRCGLIEMGMPMAESAKIRMNVQLQARKASTANSGASLFEVADFGVLSTITISLLNRQAHTWPAGRLFFTE